MKKIKAFLINGLAMTVTTILIGLIGVWFSVYISNKIGTETMGLFQLIMSVYSFAITFATSGINLASTRLVAQALGVGDKSAVRGSIKRCILYSIFFGLLGAVLLFGLSDFIGTYWLQNKLTVLPLRVMAVSLPFIGMTSAINGYFTAVRRVIKNAAVQITEQLVKITITIMLLTVFAPKRLDYVCVALVLAGIVSEVISFICSFVMYKLDSKRYKTKRTKNAGLTGKMLGIALPIAVSSYLRTGLLTAKNLLVPIRLGKYGLTKAQAYTAFGMLHGIVLPVVLFPCAFLTSFSNLIIPELAECQAQNSNIKESKRVHYIMNRTFQITLAFSIGAAGIFFCFSDQLSAAVSSDATAAFYIMLFAPLVPVMYFDGVVDSMLKGLNEQVSSMRYNIIDSFVSMVLVFILLPVFGVKGYVFIIFLSEVLNAALSLNRLILKTKLCFDVIKFIVKPIICIAVSGIIIKVLDFNLLDSLAPAVECTILGALTLGMYIVLLVLTKAFSTEDIKWFKGIFAKK